MSGPSPISFLSDYGLEDEFVGVCHGVIARLCPHAHVIDVSHEIPRHDVRRGALVLRAAVAYLPAGVHLAVVDPGVGASGENETRRAVAIRAKREQRTFVGPDNGLLMPSADSFGGVAEAVDIGASPVRLEPVSSTFHGRDIFAPVAAALARGAPLAALGEPIESRTLVELQLPEARVSDQTLHAHVLAGDGFGNLLLDAGAGQLESLGAHAGDALALEHSGRVHAARLGRAFADVPAGELVLYEDSRRALALAVNRGSAAERLGARADDEIAVRRA